MRFVQAVLIASSVFIAAPALAHGGGLNHCGCHINHKTGDCHCHRDYGACDCKCRPASCGGFKDDAAACADETAQMVEFVSARVQARSGYKSGSKGSSTHVRGYTKKDGTYVAPHRRSAPDKSKANNWSTKGNVNPYTGKDGTKDPLSK